MHILLLPLLLFAITGLNAVTFDPNDFPDLVSGLPNYTSGTPPLSYAGFAPIDSQNNSALFYWYFPARGVYSNDVPTLIWLNGGPGSPSMFGLFVENGPFRFKLNSDGGYSLYSIDELGKYQSWTAYYNVLFIDQPVGTGYSYTANNSYAQNEDDVGRDMWTALQYFTTVHPETLGSKWYFTGESYAGRYIPACAYWTLQNNDQVRAKQLQGNIINLQGILVGDGFVLAVSQRITSIFASQTGNLLTPNEYRQAQTLAAECQQLSTAGPDQLQQAISKCSSILGYLEEVSGIDALAINLAGDVTGSLGDPMGDYLNNQDVIKALHVDGSKKQGPIFTAESDDVAQNLQGEQLGNSLFYINNLLNRIPCVFYEGNFDAQDGSYGISDWFKYLDGSYPSILTSNRNIWYIDQGTAGLYTTYQNLTYIVFDFAGHFVPYFELNATVKMIDIFTLRGGDWNYYSGLNPTPISDIMCQYSKNCHGNGGCTSQGTCNCNDGYGLADCSAQATTLNTLTTYTLNNRGYLFFKVTLSGNDKLIQFHNEGGVLAVHYTPFNNGPVADEEEAESSLLQIPNSPSIRSLYLTSYGKTTGYLTVHNTQWFSPVSFTVSISTPPSALDADQAPLNGGNQPNGSHVNYKAISYVLYALSFFMITGAIALLVRLKKSGKTEKVNKEETTSLTETLVN